MLTPEQRDVVDAIVVDFADHDPGCSADRILELVVPDDRVDEIRAEILEALRDRLGLDPYKRDAADSYVDEIADLIGARS